MTTVSDARPIEFPEGYELEGRALLSRLNSSALDPRLAGLPQTRDWRRAQTIDNPLLFALIYLRHHLRQQDTGLCSLSMFHVKLAQRARRWATRFGYHDIDVAMRGGAKSTWGLILGLWAAAHGHRQCLLWLGYTDTSIKIHLDSLRGELEENRLLLSDFPKLAIAPKNRGRDFRTLSGVWFAARTLQGTSLGYRRGTLRPDVIMGDDIQPMESDYTLDERAKIENKLVKAFLPMGAPHVVVQLFGTTTMHGCLMHDAVRAARREAVAPWIDAHEFDCHHWPALLDEGTPDERSSWPQRYSTRWLQAKRAKDGRDYALNYANDPALAPADGFWTPSLFVRGSNRGLIQRRIIYADVAMTTKRTSDKSAIVVASLSADGRKAVIEHAEMGQWKGKETYRRMLALTERSGGTITEWWVESNQGGDWGKDDVFTPVPPGVKLTLEHVGGRKKDRIHAALALYQDGKVAHFGELPQLEQQACTWQPWSKEDDLLDALAGALRKLFGSAAKGAR